MVLVHAKKRRDYAKYAKNFLRPLRSLGVLVCLFFEKNAKKMQLSGTREFSEMTLDVAAENFPFTKLYVRGIT